MLWCDYKSEFQMIYFTPQGDSPRMLSPSATSMSKSIVPSTALIASYTKVQGVSCQEATSLDILVADLYNAVQSKWTKSNLLVSPACL
jgi:hypothetical protein